MALHWIYERYRHMAEMKIYNIGHVSISHTVNETNLLVAFFGRSLSHWFLWGLLYCNLVTFLLFSVVFFF